MGVTSVRYQARCGLESEGIMAGVDFLLPMAAGAALSWASYSVAAMLYQNGRSARYAQFYGGLWALSHWCWA